MTLVEVIVAMAIFSVITTGFCMTASYCLKAQTKARTRLTDINRQTTIAEDFGGRISNDEDADNGDAVVVNLGSGSNQWTFTYDFPDVLDAQNVPGVTVENSNVTGFMVETPDTDPLYQMVFFSVEDTVDLKVGANENDPNNEYWITVKNCSTDEEGLAFAVEFDSGSTGIFFDNLKRPNNPMTSLENRIIAPKGLDVATPGTRAFGVKGANPTIKFIDFDSGNEFTFKPTDFEVAEGTHKCVLCLNGRTYVTQAAYDAANSAAPAGE